MASCVTSAKPTRSGGSIAINFEIEYPAIDQLDKLKLPTNKEIIGMVKKFKNSNTWEESIDKVTHILQKHWIDRNVYPFAVKNIKARVSKEVNLYKDLKKKQAGRSTTENWKEKASKFIEKKDKLFDIYCEDAVARKKQEEKHGIPMQPDDFQYLESMRTDRKVICESKVDKEWHESEKKKKEKREHYLQTQYNTTPRAVPVEDNEISSNSDNSEEYLPVEDCDTSPRKRARDSNTPRRKKSKYINILEDKDDKLPYHLRHVRTSEKEVRDEVSIFLS